MRLTLLALAASVATPAEAKTTVTTSQVGPFAIITEVDDISETPIMHVPLITRSVRLEWKSEDGRARFGLSDDGNDLTASYGIAKPGAGDLICGKPGGGELLQYPDDSNFDKQWASLEREWIIELSTTCKVIVSDQQLASYKKDFEGSVADYLPAIEKMKLAAREQFGGWRRRCLNYKHIKDTWAGFRCVRQSAKEN